MATDIQNTDAEIQRAVILLAQVVLLVFLEWIRRVLCHLRRDVSTRKKRRQSEESDDENFDEESDDDGAQDEYSDGEESGGDGAQDEYSDGDDDDESQRHRRRENFGYQRETNVERSGDGEEYSRRRHFHR